MSVGLKMLLNKFLLTWNYRLEANVQPQNTFYIFGKKMDLEKKVIRHVILK